MPQFSKPHKNSKEKMKWVPLPYVWRFIFFGIILLPVFSKAMPPEERMKRVQLLSPEDIKKLPEGTFVSVIQKYDGENAGKLIYGIGARNDGHLTIAKTWEGLTNPNLDFEKNLDTRIHNQYRGGGFVTSKDGAYYRVPRNSTQSMFLHGNSSPTGDPQMPAKDQYQFFQDLADDLGVPIKEGEIDFLKKHVNPGKLTLEENELVWRGFPDPVAGENFMPKKSQRVNPCTPPNAVQGPALPPGFKKMGARMHMFRVPGFGSGQLAESMLNIFGDSLLPYVVSPEGLKSQEDAYEAIANAEQEAINRLHYPERYYPNGRTWSEWFSLYMMVTGRLMQTP